VLAASGTGLLAATASTARAAARSRKARAAGGDGTPEQIHLTWGENPATSVVVSWASPGPAVRPRVLLRPGHAVPAVQRTYTDGLNGETVWTYHAEIRGLAPGSTHQYTVTADNDSSATPFASAFTTAPRGRAAFRFTSFGDLATPNTQ
jgi:phosphodiesterase/alkaline phosphatase D-like protein